MHTSNVSGMGVWSYMSHIHDVCVCRAVGVLGTCSAAFINSLRPNIVVTPAHMLQSLRSGPDRHQPLHSC